MPTIEEIWDEEARARGLSEGMDIGVYFRTMADVAKAMHIRVAKGEAVEEPAPEAKPEPRCWRVVAHPTIGCLHSVQAADGEYHMVHDPMGSRVWSASMRRTAAKKAKELNSHDI